NDVSPNRALKRSMRLREKMDRNLDRIVGGSAEISFDSFSSNPGWHVSIQMPDHKVRPHPTEATRVQGHAPEAVTAEILGPVRVEHAVTDDVAFHPDGKQPVAADPESSLAGPNREIYQAFVVGHVL